MLRKVVLLVVMCICLYSPIGSAELYRNRDYNFQIEIPSSWMNNKINPADNYLFSKGISYQKDGIGRGAGIGLKISPRKYVPNSDALKDLTEQGKRDFFAGFIKAAQEKYPGFKVTYSNVINVGGYSTGVVKGELENPLLKITIAMIEKDENDYMFTFVTNDPNRERETEFFDMLKTLKPIISDDKSTGIIEDDVKYMRDIAERDVINKYTTAEVKIEMTNNNNVSNDVDIDGMVR